MGVNFCPVVAVVYLLTNITSKYTENLKLNIGLHTQLKMITGKRVAYHGCNLTKISNKICA